MISSQWELRMTLKYTLQCSLILPLPIQALIWWFHFPWFLYTENHNAKRGIGKGYRQQLRNFKHKGNHKIGCFPKHIVVFTVYQIQGWRTMILKPVKYQPDGSNVREIIIKRLWYIHLKYSKTYIRLDILRRGLL